MLNVNTTATEKGLAAYGYDMSVRAIHEGKIKNALINDLTYHDVKSIMMWKSDSMNLQKKHRVRINPLFDIEEMANIVDMNIRISRYNSVMITGDKCIAIYQQDEDGFWNEVLTKVPSVRPIPDGLKDAAWEVDHLIKLVMDMFD